jgi:membrane fusion protein (multidrug efflux system)
MISSAPAIEFPDSADETVPSQYASRESVQPQIDASPRRRLQRRILLGVAGCLVIAAAIGGYIHYASGFEETDNAFVEAHVHPISSRVSGDVVEVLVDDNALVKRGQVLARLDRRDFAVKTESARAVVEQAAAEVTRAEAGVAQATAAIAQAEAQVRATDAQLLKARLDFDRGSRLYQGERKVISKQEFDAMKAAFDLASGNHDAALAGCNSASAEVRTAEANLAAARARHDQALAERNNAELQLSYTEIVAPTDGRIGKKTVEAGQHLEPGQALMAVVDTENWIVANFKENQLAQIKAGQPVEVAIDAIGARHFHGRVDSFAPGTGAKFALLPPDNATGNFTKIVQRVPVKIVLDAADAAGFEDRIAPGLSALVTVRIRE